MAARRRQDIEGEKVKYYVSVKGSQDFIIEIPADWKVTFGWVNPAGAQRSGYGNEGGHCMRVWEGEKLRAVYSSVTGFRDMSIPLARKVTRETGNNSWTMDSEGNFESSKSVSVEHELLLEDGEEEAVFE